MKFRNKKAESLDEAIQQEDFKTEAEKAFEEAAANTEYEQERMTDGKEQNGPQRKSFREVRRELKAQDEALRDELSEKREKTAEQPYPSDDFIKNSRSRRKKLAVAAFVLLLAIGILGNWYYENSDFVGSVRPLITGTDTKTLGEAEFVGATTTIPAVSSDESAYYSAARLDREKAREEALEKLQNVINSTEESPEAKQTASEAISRLSNYISAENKIETLVTAKGVRHCLAVVSVDGMKVDVIVDCEELTDELSLQIKEIAMQQLGCSFDAVSIIQSKE